MTKYQRGFTLSGLIVWGAVVAMIAMLGIKVAPTVIEYYKILKDCKSVAAQVSQGATVADVKRSFSKFAEVDHLDFTADQLDITKEGGQVVISFDYEKRIPLFANVTLLINYKGSTGASGKE